MSSLRRWCSAAKILTSWTIVLAVFLWPPAVVAVEAIPPDDASVSEASPSVRFGAKEELTVGGADGFRSYLRFDLSVLPEGVTGDQITKATLKVFLGRVTRRGGLDVAEVTGAWNERTITFANAPDPGSLLSSRTVLPRDRNDYILVDVTALVRSWVDGDAPNHGVVLLPHDGTTLDVGFDSKEAKGTGHHPLLDVTLTGAGTSGPTGPIGPPGATGPSGPSGPEGASGADGAEGAVGPPGPVGASGPAGAVGATGPVGPTGPSGSLGPLARRVRSARPGRGPVGSDRCSGFERACGTGRRDGVERSRPGRSVRRVRAGLRVRPATPGRAAPSGPAGATGPIGRAGSGRRDRGQRSRGPDRWSTGSSGPSGPAGDTGASGSRSGPLGARVSSGPTGPAGETGASGPCWGHRGHRFERDRRDRRARPGPRVPPVRLGA